MTTLDKQFLKEYYNKPGFISNYDEYVHYLKNDVKEVLKGNEITLISHFLPEYNCNEDVTTFVFYKYKKDSIIFYILIEIFTGTCSGCFDGPEYTLDYAIEKSYITSNREDAENYLNKRRNSMF
jgi:hypothetical protein